MTIPVSNVCVSAAAAAARAELVAAALFLPRPVQPYSNIFILFFYLI